MTRYYNLRVFYSLDKNEGEESVTFPLMTKSMLDATLKVFEEHYDRGFYKYLRIEYYIVQ